MRMADDRPGPSGRPSRCERPPVRTADDPDSRTRRPPTRARPRARPNVRRRSPQREDVSREISGRHYRLSAVSDPFRFDVTARDGHARRGRLCLPHGTIETPAFMPVGTRGAVKGVTVEQLHDLGAEILLANTYHLHLRPGDELIARVGGLHRFTGWRLPILTDSGGYQVFSLATRATVGENGVVFRSHIDGSLHTLTPESVVDIQARLGSDITMAFDQCPSWPVSRDDAEAAMARTLRWARRSRDRFMALAAGDAPDVLRPSPEQAQFGIVQGGTHKELRDLSVRGTVDLDFDAYAIGGLSVGEPVETMYDIVGHTAPQLPEDRPRYLMGTGMPD